MKKVVKYLVLLMIILIPINVKAKEKVNLNLFYSKTCRHCHAEIEFLEDIKKEYPNVKINLYEKDEYTSLLKRTRSFLKIDNSYVPLTIVGTDYIIGFNDSTKDQIKEMLDAYDGKSYCDIVSVKNKKDVDKCFDKNDGIYSESEYKKIPFLGKVNVKDTSLFFIALIIGLVDGFNPCAMWILLFLISTLIGMKDKKRLWILGITFLASSALVYLAFMVSWLSFAKMISSLALVRLIIAVVAVTGGVLNLKSYIKHLDEEDGCDVVDAKKRKKIFTKIKKFTHEKSFFIALLGIILLAASVNIIEIACSAGLPVIFTQILAMNNLSKGLYALYILIYILFFMLDDLIVFTIAVKTMELTGISTKYSKYSHLVGGILMLLIGILLLLKPEWLMFNF